MKIYLAPLQGFTDFVYRRAYAGVFAGLDAFFIPYISAKNGQVPKKYTKEVLPENNPAQNTVPQVLVKDAAEMQHLAEYLAGLGYKEINLNLGCPYPMVTNRGRGAGLLPNPKKIESIVAAFFEIPGLRLSVKLRAGMESPEELKAVLPVLNKFPLKELILHPRIAGQLYEGDIFEEAFRYAAENTVHQLVYNGDVFSPDDFRHRYWQFPGISGFMLGRGILMDPFLPARIKGLEVAEAERHEKLREFHDTVFEGYLETMDNEGNALNKMKQFWIYFSFNFQDPKKALKVVRKSKSLVKYRAEISRLL